MPFSQAVHRNPLIWIALFHGAALVIGFSLLANVFSFPEVLRFTAQDRFSLYLQQQSIVQPTYWLLTITGFSQMALAIGLCNTLSKPLGSLYHISLISGVLTGLLQAMGFVRWVIVIPFLAHESIGASAEKLEWLALIEGALNSYVGMALGEHLANLCLGAWTASTALLLFKAKKIDPLLKNAGLILGMVGILLAGEQLGLAEGLLDIIVDFALPAWLIWIFAIAYAVPQQNYRTSTKSILSFSACYLLLVAPTFL